MRTWTNYDPAAWTTRPGWLTFAQNRDVQFQPTLGCNITGIPQTFLCKIRCNAFTANPSMWNVANNANTNIGMYFYIQTNGKINFSWFNSNYSQSLYRLTSTVLAINTDYSIALTLNGSGLYSDIHIYIDGIEAAYESGNNNAISNLQTMGGPWRLTEQYANWLNGSYQYAAWFNRILSQQEIIEWHTNPFGAFVEPAWTEFPTNILSQSSMAVIYHLAQMSAA